MKIVLIITIILQIKGLKSNIFKNTIALETPSFLIIRTRQLCSFGTIFLDDLNKQGFTIYMFLNK